MTPPSNRFRAQVLGDRTVMTVRAAIYARFSSENQREASIDDQVRLCRERIAREGWTVIDVYRDAAISGATTFRPGYQALIEDARNDEFDIIVAEALDRLSRDQEDVAALFKRTQFAGIKIVTLAEGEISELHVGLKGTMNALFLKDLAQKTHRGLRGRIEAGKSAGGRCYGYDVVRRTDEHGELVRGDRAVNPGRRPSYSASSACSPRVRARSPSRSISTRRASPARQDVAGGTQPSAATHAGHRHPAERALHRPAGMEPPDLHPGPSHGPAGVAGEPRCAANCKGCRQRFGSSTRTLWDAVQDRLAGIRTRSGADDPDRPRYWETRRAHHLLTSKVFCGCCDGAMTNIGRDYLACSSARRQGTVHNAQGIRRNVLEKLILDGLEPG